MFINDVHKKEEIRNIAIQDLKTFGLKYRPKKSRQHIQDTKCRKLFKQPLQFLPMETVTLPSGQQLVVPRLVEELCSFIITKIDTEGLFRKGGSKSRQNEIKLSLDAGCYLGLEHHEIDVASVLKTFFRELPDPLIPYSYHELFLRCVLLPKNQRETVLLSCLLLPTEHLNTLTYFMQFLNRVAKYMEFNKMSASNLAIVMGPTLLPAEEKLSQNATQRVPKTCELFQLLIENAENIGVLSENIIERIALTSSSISLNVDEDTLSIKKKKKRRSGSLTRMLSGLKKIVTSKSEDIPHAPDILLTPCLTRSSKKRKMEVAGLSLKKRRDILSNLPHSSILHTPFTPSRTPVNVHPTGRNNVSPECQTTSTSSKNQSTKEKKLIWKSNSKSSKKQDDTTSQKSRLSLGPPSMLQRRCSAVSSAMGFKRKKTRNSCIGTLNEDTNKVIEKDPQIDNRINDLSEELIKQKDVESLESESAYVKIPVQEYEEIKNRVSAIERRISIELDNAQIETKKDDGFKDFETAYEETLQVGPMCSSTDQLAKRLSRELKIRKSSENRVFRSPSARKIGSLRRRSKELQNRSRLSRNQSWHVSGLESPRSKLQRGKPNTIMSGLPQPSIETIHSGFIPPASLRRVTRSSSFHGEGLFSPSTFQNTNSYTSNNSYNSTNSFVSSSSYVSAKSNISTHWTSAQGFFKTPNISNPTHENCRASIAKLRTQNAGMVLAKARLFDNLDSDSSCNKSNEVVLPRVKSNKIGAARNVENRQSYRVRALKIDDRTKGKKTMSPRKRSCKSPNTTKSQRLQLARAIHNSAAPNDKPKNALRDFNRLESMTSSPRTPRNVPHIKKSLNVKSPRRICRTPTTTDKQTPLKVMPTVKRQLY